MAPSAIIAGVERRVFLLVIALVIALGAYLRLVDLGGPSLWLDEILHLQVTRSLADEPWYRHLLGVREIEGETENGALYYRLQIWGQRLMPGDAGARLFPAVVGILALPLMALAGHLHGGRPAALAATFLLAVSPFHVYLSREGRPYSLLMAMALLLLCALLMKGSRAGIWTAWAGCPLAAYVGIHSLPILLAFAALSALALASSLRHGHALRRSPFVHYVAAATLGLGLVYGLYLTRSQANVPVLEKSDKLIVLERSPRFQSPLSKTSLTTFLASMTTSGHPSVPLARRSWALLALAGLAAGLRRPREIVATAGMFVLPAALSIAALVATGRSYTTRYTSPALPAFLLLAALGITALAGLVSRAAGRLAARGEMPAGKRAALRWAVVVLLLVFVAPNLAAARADPNRKLDWRGVARFFDAVALPGEPVLVPNPWPEICLGYYLRQLGTEVEFVQLWESAAIGQSVVDERPQGWLLTAGFRRTNEVRAWMHAFVPVLKKREEEMDLFFFPDFATLLATRYAAGRAAVFEAPFKAMDRRFAFGGGEALLQGRGWSYPEENAAGIDFQWALGERAELGLPVGAPRDAAIRFRALPLSYPGAPPQRVELRLGGTRLATLELPEGWSEHRVEVPASSWSPGANVLTLHFARSARPADVLPGSPDLRRLSAAFDYLEVVP